MTCPKCGAGAYIQRVEALVYNCGSYSAVGEFFEHRDCARRQRDVLEAEVKRIRAWIDDLDTEFENKEDHKRAWVDAGGFQVPPGCNVYIGGKKP